MYTTQLCTLVFPIEKAVELYSNGKLNTVCFGTKIDSKIGQITVNANLAKTVKQFLSYHTECKVCMNRYTGVFMNRKTGQYYLGYEDKSETRKMICVISKDHLRPKSLGGNITEYICSKCNNLKANREITHEELHKEVNHHESSIYKDIGVIIKDVVFYFGNLPGQRRYYSYTVINGVKLYYDGTGFSESLDDAYIVSKADRIIKSLINAFNS